jgi:hypothetical protein
MVYEDAKWIHLAQYPFKDEAKNVLFKDPVRTAL